MKKMIDYLINLIPRIKNYGFELDKLSKLYNYPWVIISEPENFSKIIFQKNGKLLLSSNGIVSYGNWELISMANSILLEMNGQKRLFNHQFLDEAVMILKLDGTTRNYMILANQNKIPDLKIKEYFKKKYFNPTSRENKKQNGLNKESSKYYKILDLEKGEKLYFLGQSAWEVEVEINKEHPANGFYKSKDLQSVFEIEDGILKMEYYVEKIDQDDGSQLEIYASRQNGIKSGCKVFLNGIPAPDGVYKKGWFSRITVRNGRIK